MPITELRVYGCSFTGGSELMDHVLSPDAESIKLQHGHQHWLEQQSILIQQQGMDASQFEQQEKQQVWAAEIARRHGLAYHNHARNGSGMTEIVDTLERHWHQGILDDPCVLVLIGVTTHTRPMMWLDHRHTDTLMMTDLPDHWHKPTFIDFCSDEWLTHQHLTNLLRLVQISDALKGRLIMFDMVGQTRTLPHIHKPSHPFCHRWREIVRSGHTRFNFNLQDMMGPGEQHAGLHPHQVVHRRFAEWCSGQLGAWL